MNGTHLLVDGKNVSVDVDEESTWREIFDKTVVATDTNKMRDFDLVRFPKQGGTAFLVLSESHISVHTYPEDNAYYFDVYSCKDFNPEDVIKILKTKLGEHELKSHVMKR